MAARKSATRSAGIQPTGRASIITPTALLATIDDRRALALLSGYESLAPLTLAEGQLLPALLGYAALTFALSRLTGS